MEKKIFLDLDGVILDSEKRVVDLKKTYNDLSWDDFFNIIDWDKLLSESISINNSVEIINDIQKRKNNISILTKVHTLLEAQAKINELRNKRNITIPIIIVPPHIRKSQIYIPTNGEILVDDSEKNINDWNIKGGRGILFCHDDNIDNNKVKSLEFLLK